MSDELLDVVDDNDLVVGTIGRKEYQKLLAQNVGYIRAAELFIVNDRSQVWVPVRTATKIIAPNGYDYSAAGHVESGDNYVDTIIRETKEEINLEITADELEFVAKMKSEDIKYFRGVFVLRSNSSPNFNPDDFVSAEWLTPDELLENIKNGHPAKNGMVETIVALKSYLNRKK